MRIRRNFTSVRKSSARILIFGLFLLSYPPLLKSQNPEQQKGSGKLVIYQAAEVDTLLSRVYFDNSPKSTIKGYRVQIYSGSNRVDANKVRADFLETYMGEKIYFDYKQPYYKVRVGDYRNKVEAQRMLQALLADTRFNGVLIVPDDINFPDLKTNNPPNE